jgi:hypothetical protein
LTDVTPEPVESSTGYDIPSAEPTPRQQQGIPDEVICSFVMFMDTQGHWAAHSDLAIFDDVVVRREANFNDFTAGCQSVGNTVLLRQIDVANNEALQQMAQVLGQSLVNAIPPEVLKAQVKLAEHVKQQAEAGALAEKLFTPNRQQRRS